MSSAALTLSEEVITTSSTSSVTIQQAHIDIARNSGMQPFTRTSGSGESAASIFKRRHQTWDSVNLVKLKPPLCDRNYLLHVAESISDWTKVEELKRKAAQLRNISPAECSGGTDA